MKWLNGKLGDFTGKLLPAEVSHPLPFLLVDVCASTCVCVDAVSAAARSFLISSVVHFHRKSMFLEGSKSRYLVPRYCGSTLMEKFLSIKSQRIHMCALVYTVAVQWASISKMRSVKSTCRVIGINKVSFWLQPAVARQYKLSNFHNWHDDDDDDDDDGFIIDSLRVLHCLHPLHFTCQQILTFL